MSGKADVINRVIVSNSFKGYEKELFKIKVIDDFSPILFVYHSLGFTLSLSHTTCYDRYNNLPNALNVQVLASMDTSSIEKSDVFFRLLEIMEREIDDYLERMERMVGSSAQAVIQTGLFQKANQAIDVLEAECGLKQKRDFISVQRELIAKGQDEIDKISGLTELDFDEIKMKEKVKSDVEIREKSLHPITHIFNAPHGFFWRSKLENSLCSRFECEVYTYASLGYSFSAKICEKYHTGKAFEGHEVTRIADGVYKVSERYSYGTTRSRYISVYSHFDYTEIYNIRRFNELRNDAVKACNECCEIVYHSTSEKDISDAKRAFFKKVDEICAMAQKECGLKSMRTPEQARREIIENCSAK